ncbi:MULTISPECIES: hypothetical protein [Paenibacillus]|uniref:DUF4025 domain-containing protein n=1 Tax=Paenibacillus oleatilyticus TaxID=2594886 RepID=A0ABV4V4Z9_9BACL|nr:MULTISPECIES: hypothetical protein [Paenibacillus]MBU7319717.1 hypothetical protein [Paenibacillus oleatilyticus]MCP1309746.1 hypothetical protein [Paenibacillus tyrfis]GLI09374.1 hypothetical protein YDYSG_54060 [Paenibacillus tyrfis]GMX60425.1 hypothetical protein Elgi_05870 [Paenibacillus elgii]
MASSRGHQGAHGIGQAEEQLANQADAAAAIQGQSETDLDVLEAARQYQNEEEKVLDEP